jgi:hypothetical protein
MGHATEGEVREGKSTEENRVQHTCADTSAGNARKANLEWEGADLFCNAFAVRDRTYSKLCWQIGIQNTRVFLAFDAEMEKAKRLAPFTNIAEPTMVPTTLEYAEPTSQHLRFFNFQVCGILHDHVKESLPV